MDIADINYDYSQYIKIELLILVPVLVIIGKIIKDSSFVNNKHIPLILGVVSIVLSCAWLIIIEHDSFPHALITGIIQGILLAGMAVYSNQIFKQYTGKDI